MDCVAALVYAGTGHMYARVLINNKRIIRIMTTDAKTNLQVLDERALGINKIKNNSSVWQKPAVRLQDVWHCCC